MKKNILFVFSLFLTVSVFAQSNTDSIPVKKGRTIDTAAMRKFNPHKATLYSTILPGLGQAYNKKYWKIPIVYAALGFTTERFFANQKQYNRIKRAYGYLTDNDPSNDVLIDPDLRRLDKNALSFYRRQFRKNMDYSVLFFVVFWGLNIADATVDAHLKYFDVNDNLSLKVKPVQVPNSNLPGLSLSFNIHKAKNKSALTR
jgi:hypothetical protein